MKATAIVYTSKTGHTRRYAGLLGESLGLPVCSLEEAGSRIPGGSPVIYLGWLRASRVMGYSKAAGRFDVRAVCGIGLCDTGTMTAEVRKTSAIPEYIPLFTLQGGIDRGKLKGLDKLMISMFTKGLASQKQRSPQEERMLELLGSGADLVSPENLAGVLRWDREECGE